MYVGINAVNFPHDQTTTRFDHSQEEEYKSLAQGRT